MKRLFQIIIFGFMICVLTSCAPPEPELNDSFDVPLSITGTLDCTAELSRTGDAITLVLTSPDTLSGLSYTYTNGGLTASYNGLSCITDGGALPDTALPRILYAVVTDIKNAAYLRSDEEGDVFQLQGATVTLRDGLPVRVDVTDPAYSILAK